MVVGEDINLEVRPGRLVGIVGPNGVGKSTLIRTLIGNQPALRGAVYLNGIPLGELSPPQLARELSVVLTQPPASMNLRVEEMVGLGRQPHTNWLGKLTEADQEYIQKAMAFTDTVELSNRRCHELSDGQLQRVAIARALAQDTPVILLDEPTTHLDLYHRAYVFKLLRRLSRETGKTILFSTHEIEMAIELSDLMLVMYQDGNDFGSPNDLTERDCFGKLFPDESVHFDKATGRFSFRK
jgi:iron complex transport system ATP-binding protein